MRSLVKIKSDAEARVLQAEVTRLLRMVAILYSRGSSSGTDHPRPAAGPPVPHDWTVRNVNEWVTAGIQERELPVGGGASECHIRLYDNNSTAGLFTGQRFPVSLTDCG